METFMRLGGVLGVALLANWPPVTQATAAGVGQAGVNPSSPIPSNFVACPKAGTVSKGRSTLGEYTTHWEGADPRDPTMCIGKSETSGKSWRRMYAYFDLTSPWRWQQGEDQARTAMGFLLSGLASKGSFSKTLTKPGSSVVQTLRETWERTGAADVPIGNRTVKAIVFRRIIEGRAASIFLGTQQLWYDPADHLFIRGHLDIERGSETNRDFEVTSILPP